MTRRRRCPLKCLCICHDTNGGGHDHEGAPCPGKETRPCGLCAGVGTVRRLDWQGRPQSWRYPCPACGGTGVVPKGGAT